MAKTDQAELQRFRQIYEDNQLFVRKSLYWITGQDVVDEIVQEVFIKIWKALPKFKGESTVKTWVYRITMNCAYDCLKKEKRKLKMEQPSDDLSPSNPESEVVVEQVVRDAFKNLSKKQKEVFLLYYIQGLPVEEVAKLTEIAEGTVKSRLSSSRDIVEEVLKKHGVKL